MSNKQLFIFIKKTPLTMKQMPNFLVLSKKDLNINLKLLKIENLDKFSQKNKQFLKIFNENFKFKEKKLQNQFDLLSWK